MTQWMPVRSISPMSSSNGSQLRKRTTAGVLRRCSTRGYREMDGRPH
jgi:hypothetical protein